MHFDGQTSSGKAHLETEEIVFRGDFRLAIPLREVHDARAVNGQLTVHFAGGQAVFELGRQAEKWATSIRSPKSLLDKLGVKPGLRITLLGPIADTFRAQLAGQGSELAERAGRKKSDLIFVAVEAKHELTQLAALARYLEPNGALWVIRPKGRRDVTEADVLAAGKSAGLVDTKVVRFSETHTAEKFVIPVSRR